MAEGRYRLDAPLGGSSRKRVYLARDLQFGRDVALSLLRRADLDPSVEARLARETRHMARLGEHPCIVEIYDAGEDADFFYLAGPVLEGGNLEELLARSRGRRLPVDRALALFDDVCDALSYAHARGVVHRDIKPAHVWLTADGRAKLGDFGLAIFSEWGRTGDESAIAGTLAYLPPEQALGRPIDARSDLYSAGAMLYEMLTGQLPFTAEDAATLIAQHVDEAPAPPSRRVPELPEALDALVISLLAKHPDERPASAREVRELVRALRGAADRSPPARADSGRPGDLFVGRQAEMAELASWLEKGLGGAGGVAMLIGEPGVGKTRTALQLGERAREAGARVIVGRCIEGDTPPAYWPWQEILRGYARAVPAEQLREDLGPAAAALAELVPELRSTWPDLEPLPPVDPEQARFRLFDGLLTFLRNAAARGKLYLLLDDLHWADQPSLLLLDFVGQGLGEEQLVIVATARDPEAETPLEHTVATLARHANYSAQPLHGLLEEEVRDLVEALSGRAVSPAVALRIRDQTGGNPFFVGEVVRHLREESPEAPSLADPRAVEAIRIPAGVRDVILRRVSRLQESCVRALEVASVIGREFDLDCLAGVLEVPAFDLLDELDRAVRAQLIAEVPGAGRYSFAHALVRETLYGHVSRGRRVALHGRIAEELESLHGGAEHEVLDALAYHYAEAAVAGGPNVGRAIDYARRAAERASSLLAFEDAAAHSRRALRLLEGQPPDEARRCEVLLELATSRARIDVYDEEAEQSFGEAAGIARRLGAPRLLAAAALGLSGAGGRVYEVGRQDPRRIRLLEEATSALDEGEIELRAHLCAVLSTELCFADPDRARGLSDVAIELAERAGSPALLALALERRHWALWGPGNTEERLSIADRIIGLGQESRDENLQMHGYHFRIMDNYELGDVAAVDRDMAPHHRIATDLGLPVYRWWMAAADVCRATVDGRFAEAARLAQRALEIGQHAEKENAFMAFAAQMGLVRREQGQLSQEAMRATLESFPGVPGWHCAYAVACYESGNLEDARRELEQLIESDFRNLPRDANWITSLTLITEVCAGLGDAQAAARIYERLRPYADRAAVFGYAVACTGAATRYLGMLAATMKRFDEAEAHFQEALDFESRMGARPWKAHTEHEYARMLLARGGPGDRTAATRLVARSLQTAEELGMRNLLRKLLTLKLRLQGVERAEIRSSLEVVTSSVERERPDLRMHAAPDGNVTLIFSDVVGFTEMTERLGDLESHRVMTNHNKIVRARLAAHGGFEVELQGDGFLLAFASPHTALECAVDIREELASYTRSHPERPLHVRMGVHCGEVIKELDRFFGRTVILAARIAAQAERDEILVSRAVRDAAPELAYGAGRELELKGFRGIHDTYPLPGKTA